MKCTFICHDEIRLKVSSWLRSVEHVPAFLIIRGEVSAFGEIKIPAISQGFNLAFQMKAFVGEAKGSERQDVENFRSSLIQSSGEIYDCGFLYLVHCRIFYRRILLINFINCHEIYVGNESMLFFGSRRRLERVFPAPSRVEDKKKRGERQPGYM